MGISAAQALQRHASSSPFWQNSSQQGEFAKHLKSALQLRPDSQDFRGRVFGIGRGPRKGFKNDKAQCYQHLALDLHPRGHSRRCLGDCFPQALTASWPTKNGVSERRPRLRMAHERSCFWQNIVSEETCERHSEISPTYPARLTRFSVSSLRHRKGSPKGVQKRQSPVYPAPGRVFERKCGCSQHSFPC